MHFYGFSYFLFLKLEVVFQWKLKKMFSNNILKFIEENNVSCLLDFFYLKLVISLRDPI